MSLTRASVDAIVIGAGPAGLTCARDLHDRGYSVQILEARDRIGGRTWTADLEGYPGERIELGGTYINPTVQHNLAREIRRYGQPMVEEAGEVLAARFRVGGRLRSFPVPPEQIVDLERAVLVLAREARRIDANAELAGQFLADLDIPMDDFFRPYRLPDETREFLYGVIAAVTQCDVRQVSMLQWLAWMAGEGSPTSMFFSVTDARLELGMSALWEAMAQDMRVDISFGADVNAITTTADGALVRTIEGAELRARTCVVAVGSQVMRRIEFSPPLGADQVQLLDGQFVAPGFKAFLLVENAPSGYLGFGGFGGSDDPVIGWLFNDRELDDGKQLMLAWGNGPMPDVATAQAAIKDYLPDAVVRRVIGHDWACDPYAAGINHFRRPGEALRFTSTLKRSAGPLVLAGGDVTTGIWNGWIEGAVDSGRAAAIEAIHHLQHR